MSTDEHPSSAPGIPLSPGRAFVVILGLASVFVTLHLATGLIALLADTGWAAELYDVFNLADEANVPTFFSASLWLSAGAVCWCLSRLSRPEPRVVRSWLALTGICVFISFDEAAGLHERLIEPVRAVTGADGVLFYAWTIPYALLVVGVAVVLGRFVWNLGRPVNGLILGAAAIYVGAALGLELVEGYVASGTEGRARESNLYRALYTIEESLELLGVALFIYALLLHLQVVLRLRREPAPDGVRDVETTD